MNAMQKSGRLSVAGEAAPRSRRSFAASLRSVLGVILLGTVIAWAVHEGHMLDKIDAAVVLLSTIVGIASVTLNAMSIRSITHAFGSSLSLLQSLRLAALGSFGNALGGLPIGTALKYAILFRTKVLSIGQFTAGLAVFSVAISMWLLASASVSVWDTSLSEQLKPLPAALFSAAVAVLVVAGYAARRATLFRSYAAPFLSTPNLASVCRLSGVTSLLFIANYWIIARTLMPEMSQADIVFVSSVGILISLGSLVQSLGGVHELSMALAAFAIGHEAVSGLELALLLRLTSVLSSALLLTITFFAGPSGNEQ
jgi:uncharacterized membrane protein YbhN (UPF0104 family)